MESIKALMKGKRDTKLFSIVHEVGDEHEENANPDHDYSTGGYEHTHVFWWWKKRYDSVDPRCFDIDGIHPHIQNNKGMQWAKGIVTKYHKGQKTKSNGKKYFIEPILLEQEGCDAWHFEADLISEIIAAPSLIDACLAADIMPKSVGDIKLLRSEKKRKFTEIEEGLDKSKFKVVEWDRKKALVIRGKAASGQKPTGYRVAIKKKGNSLRADIDGGSPKETVSLYALNECSTLVVTFYGVSSQPLDAKASFHGLIKLLQTALAASYFTDDKNVSVEIWMPNRPCEAFIPLLTNLGFEFEDQSLQSMKAFVTNNFKERLLEVGV